MESSSGPALANSACSSSAGGSVNLLWRDQTLFKNIDVFDLDYLPEEYLHREKQLSQLASNLKPALKNQGL